MKTIQASVKGMTCNSCEVVLERLLRKVEGVHKISVRKSTERITLKVENHVSLEKLNEAVNEKGYSLQLLASTQEQEVIPNTKPKYKEIGAALLFLAGIYFLLKTFNLIPEVGVSDNMSLGFVFVIGLIAATSTCIAVAGGLLLAVASTYAKKNPNLTGWQKFKPHIYFNVGRIVSYTLLGGVVGALGSVLTISPQINGVLTIIVSTLMILMGFQLLQVFPWLNKFEIKMPKFVAHKIYDASSKDTNTKVSSFLFGGATFFLPCGFTQALQLYVLGTGSFYTGALVMLAFSLGTLPALAGLGVFSSFSKGNMQKHFMTLAAVLIIVLGLFNIPSGMTLAGFGASGDLENLEEVVISSGVQVVKMDVVGLNYYPSQFKLKKGVPVRWEINGRKAQGCGQVISVPSLGITEFLEYNKDTIIEFTPANVGRIGFSCTMGMAGPGVFEVTT